MRGVQFIPPGTKINFTKHRIAFLVIASLIVLGSISGVLFKGLNYGIDFRGGFLLEIQTSGKANVASLRSDLSKLGLGDVKLQGLGNESDVMIQIEQQPGGDRAQNVALEKIKDVLGTDVYYRRVETVGPKVSATIINNGLMATGLALLAMLIYIWFRFEWQFGICALLAITHDCIGILGFYSLTSLEFNETAIIAILITAGYSINDTVVIYDRIRENLSKHKKTTLVDIINKSINETLSRTVLTSGTTLLALGSLYFLGGPVVASFSLPIIVGIFIGTFSSICVASMLLLEVHFVDWTKIS
jgi:preprotein translocase subunit SecF